MNFHQRRQAEARPTKYYRGLDSAAGLETVEGRTSFGASIVPLKRKLGGDTEAGAVAAW
jgi:hypothetical protein